MCGPLSASACARSGQSVPLLLGRLSSYALAGALAGSVGRALLAVGPAKWIEALLSWSFAALLLATALGALRSPTLRHDLVPLRRKPTTGGAPWTRRARWVSQLLAPALDEPFLLGVLMALLPCGALFASLVGAATLGSATQGAVALLAFALVTSLPLLGAARLGRWLALDGRGRPLLVTLLVLGACLMTWRPIPALLAQGYAPESCHVGPTAEAR